MRTSIQIRIRGVWNCRSEEIHAGRAVDRKEGPFRRKGAVFDHPSKIRALVSNFNGFNTLGYAQVPVLFIFW
jgi:hypothetical protein